VSRYIVRRRLRASDSVLGRGHRSMETYSGLGGYAGYTDHYQLGNEIAPGTRGDVEPLNAGQKIDRLDHRLDCVAAGQLT
jgi:hypothetical protein